MLDRFSVNGNAWSGRILVTGSGGCIGAWTLALLVRAGVDVTGFDLDPAPRRPSLLMTEDELDRVTWVAGDIADPGAVREAAAGCQAIIHLAALQVPFCKADPIGGAQGQRGWHRQRARSRPPGRNPARRLREFHRRPQLLSRQSLPQDSVRCLQDVR